MINIGICEDELHYRVNIKDMLGEYIKYIFYKLQDLRIFIRRRVIKQLS